MVSYKYNLFREVFIIQLIGKLKQKVDNAAGKEEARKLIEDAGVKLTDEELELVSGGVDYGDDDEKLTRREKLPCGKKFWPSVP